MNSNIKFLNIRIKQIKNLFNDFNNQLSNGIYYSGIKGEGKYQEILYIKNVYQLFEDAYKHDGFYVKEYKNFFLEKRLRMECYIDPNNPFKFKGDYKSYYQSGKIFAHYFFTNDTLIIKHSQYNNLKQLLSKTSIYNPNLLDEFMNIKTYAKEFNYKINFKGETINVNKQT